MGNGRVAGKRGGPWRDPAVAGLLLVAGYAIAHHYGWRIMEMIDGGLIESPAWWITNGQVPYRDFGVNQGLSADLTLALAMLAFGPTLKASVIHVDVCNAVASGLAFALFRLTGLPRLAAALFAAATGVVFYPPQGLVMPMQQGALGILAALTLIAWDARRHRSDRPSARFRLRTLSLSPGRAPRGAKAKGRRARRLRAWRSVPITTAWHHSPWASATPVNWNRIGTCRRDSTGCPSRWAGRNRQPATASRAASSRLPTPLERTSATATVRPPASMVRSSTTRPSSPRRRAEGG